MTGKTVKKILSKLAPILAQSVRLNNGFTNMGGGVWKIGKLVLVNMQCYVSCTFARNDYYTVASGLPSANINSALSVTTANNGGNREANAVVSTNGSLVVQTGNDFDLTNYTIYITGIYLAGGGIVEHAFCAISSLVRRWSHEQEVEELSGTYCGPDGTVRVIQYRHTETAGNERGVIVQLTGRNRYLVCKRECCGISNVRYTRVWDAVSNAISVQHTSNNKLCDIYTAIPELYRISLCSFICKWILDCLEDTVTLERGCC